MELDKVDGVCVWDETLGGARGPGCFRRLAQSRVLWKCDRIFASGRGKLVSRVHVPRVDSWVNGSVPVHWVGHSTDL